MSNVIEDKLLNSQYVITLWHDLYFFLIVILSNVGKDKGANLRGNLYKLISNYGYLFT